MSKSNFLLISLFIPISSFGFYVSEYFISCLLIMVLIVFINQRIIINRKNFLIITLIFLIWFFSSFLRYPLNSYIPSLIITIALIIFASLKVQNIDSLKYYKLSYFFIILLSISELLFNNLNLNLFENFSEIFDRKGGSSYINNFKRLRAGFPEPSTMGLSLLLYYFIFNIYEEKKIIPIFYRYSCIVLILLTFSSSAIIGLIFFHLINILWNIKSIFIYKIKVNKNSLWNLFAIFLLIIFIFFVFFDETFEAIEKIFLIKDVFNLQINQGSAWHRVYSLIIPIEFIFNADFYNKIFGVGFSNFSEYIINYFNDSSSFSDGNLTSIYSSLLISNGLFGITIFIYFIALLTKGNDKLQSFQFFIIISLIFLSFGDLTSPLFWSMILITRTMLENCNRYTNL